MSWPGEERRLASCVKLKGRGSRKLDKQEAAIKILGIELDAFHLWLPPRWLQTSGTWLVPARLPGLVALFLVNCPRRRWMKTPRAQGVWLGSKTINPLARQFEYIQREAVPPLPDVAGTSIVKRMAEASSVED
ncbi:hypothetical protein NP233_g3019 [Leucocoprinus birnbaumii]|uniref:Uncharacterized protein n=1 Tax=Leucocoprinus birnbaumii TaxID=56174 RepID=A0AAD5VXW4_9AGAR|nr:hypothetical protein NP233_g3019 [Leucocoprinus birnbaumii]